MDWNYETIRPGNTQENPCDHRLIRAIPKTVMQPHTKTTSASQTYPFASMTKGWFRGRAFRRNQIRVLSHKETLLDLLWRKDTDMGKVLRGLAILDGRNG